MSLRSTQIFVSVLGGDSGKLRSTRTFVSILTNEPRVAAESVLSLGQAIANHGPITPTASSTLTVNDAAVSNIKMLAASSAIAASQSARSSIASLAATTALTLTDVAGVNVYDRSLSSPIDLTQEAKIVGGLLVVTAGSAIAISQSASTPTPFGRSISSTIAVTQAAVCVGPFYRDAASQLDLADEARSGIWTKQSESVLVLSDAARKLETFVLNASSEVFITDSTSGSNLHVYAESIIALSDVADNKDKRRSATTPIDTLTQAAMAERINSAVSVITLSDVAACNNFGKQVSSALALSHEARVVNILLKSNASVIELTQTLTSNIKMLSVEDAISIQQATNVLRPWHVSANSAIQTTALVFDLDTFTFVEQVSGLTDSAQATLNGVRGLSHLLSFAQEATVGHAKATGISKSADSTLGLSHEARNGVWRTVEPTVINLSQSASVLVGKELKDELSTLGVQATFAIVRANISASNTIEFKHSVAFVLEQDSLCTYSPFVGASSDPNAPTPPPSSYTPAGSTPGFRLQYPATGAVTDEVVLRNPNLGNIDRLAMVRINRESRGGTLIVFADPIWPKVETMLLSFSGLNYRQGQDLMAFMENHIGEEIRLIDWEDRLWRGVIVNPQDPLVQDGPGCQFTASFEFEGQKV